MYYLKKKKTGKKRKGNASLVKKLDRVFALYIRLRDVMPSGVFRCISCGRILPFEQSDCGHFYSRKHMATRFDEQNCHAECRGCNRMSADHIIAYRDNLVDKIGLAGIDRLRVLHVQSVHWQDFELEEKIIYYTAEVKRLSAEKGIKVNL